ncbi:MAG: hypothetical protein MUE98_00100 [Rhodobacteraceae bacterium]|jgi:hypothetical protein|nr:hypothetical protein [Paracoccaceae bacterium]
MIGDLIGGLWPYIAAGAVAVFSALGLYLKGRRDANHSTRAKAAEGRLSTIEERNRHARDADTQDDPALVDRLTRRD